MILLTWAEFKLTPAQHASVLGRMPWPPGAGPSLGYRSILVGGGASVGGNRGGRTGVTPGRGNFHSHGAGAGKADGPRVT
jgi:hypothetical protein